LEKRIENVCEVKTTNHSFIQFIIRELLQSETGKPHSRHWHISCFGVVGHAMALQQGAFKS